MGEASPPLKILHIMRSPVGGLFRHVVDLTKGQVARGHAVGIVADSTTGAERAEAVLSELSKDLALGLTRLPMSRQLGPADWSASREVARLAAHHQANVLHGHGAKGGAYARLTKQGGAIRVYTPHGGSLHYNRTSPIGMIYLTLERMLMPRTDLFLFESAYGRDTFIAKVGRPANLIEVVHNGVAPDEFEPVVPAADAADFVFVGELRALKGVDVLIDAVALLKQRGKSVRVVIVGGGPDEAAFRARAEPLGSALRFAGPMPARKAFALGRILVVPSRAESLPYIVLEGAAAGLPIIATAVGGIGEIFGHAANRLVPPGDAEALAAAMSGMLDAKDVTQAATALRDRVRAGFSTDAMTDAVLRAYAEAFGSQTAKIRRAN
jgi:glycosyltransferase involved in cell wall biosynthesis